jgi:hypothetical protein
MISPYGFLEIGEGVMPHLPRILDLARRLSESGTVILVLDPDVRGHVEPMLQNGSTNCDLSRFKLLDSDSDHLAVITALQSAVVCVLSSPELMAHLLDHQAAVFSSAWSDRRKIPVRGKLPPSDQLRPSTSNGHLRRSQDEALPRAS